MNTDQIAADTSKGHILILDDAQDNLALLEMILSSEGHTITLAPNGPQGLEEAAARRPDLVLLDINMPNMDGYEVCLRLKADPAMQDIPVIFMSSSDDTWNKVRGFEVGGIDYVTKPLHLEELLARVNTHISLYRSQREMEALRRQQINAYETANKLKDRFLRTVSHDLKNPINLIIGAVELLRDTENPIDAAQHEQLLDIIDRKANFMFLLVNDLLDLARIEAGFPPNMANIDLGELMETTLHGFDIMANRKQIALLALLPAQGVYLYADAVQLSRAVNNLISNALKYTPQGGQVQVEVRKEAEQAFITVSDNGLGIPPGDIPHLFDGFFRVRREEHTQEEGSGLGLSIARAIIEQHGGKISVESTLGVGSTFTITLPVVVPA